MRYKAVIFDFDLTLADSSSAIITCYKHTFSQLGYPVPEDKAIYDTIGRTLSDSFTILSGETDEDRKEEMRRIYVEKANSCMSRDTVFYPDAVAILQVLQNAGIKTAIVSSKMTYRIEETFMLHTGCVPVDVIVGAGDMPGPKPAPDGIYQAAMLMDVPLTDILYIGDSIIDAETARNAGVDFAAVLTGPTARREFEDLPHIFIGESLMEIFTSINNNE
ncbi:MAG: HAD-IA family hydrolase [Ruminococcus sp.]|nr:HAD-IA family hydrolase [Ruminococcus sp.]